MNQSFLQFNDAAVESGVLNLRPELRQHFKTVTETFVRLSKAATTDEDPNIEEDMADAELDQSTMFYHAATAARASGESEPRRALASPPVAEHVDIGWGYSTQLPNASDTQRHQRRDVPDTFILPNDDATQIGRRRQPLTVGQVLDQSRALEADSNTQSAPFGFIDLLTRDISPASYTTQTYYARIPSPKLTPPPTRTPTPPPALGPPSPNLSKAMQVKGPFTYSFQESSFARRLTRASLEYGFKLLNMSSVRPATIAHVFKLSLPYVTIDQMRERFRKILTRGTRDPLDCWSAPFIHLGGAGTHYPRKDENGNIIQPPNTWNVRSIGPLPKLRLESTANNGVSQELNVDIRGFEGEWFDSYDVEGYLQEKGLRIDGETSFAEAYIDADDDLTIGSSSLVFSKNVDLNLDFATTTQPPEQGRVFETASRVRTHSSTPTTTTLSSATASSTPPLTPHNAATQLDPFLSQVDAPFGLDMGTANTFANTDFDAAAIFDQPLALDLAGSFDANLFDNMGYSALDMMGAEVEPEVVKQKRKRPVLIDMQKLIDGE